MAPSPPPEAAIPNLSLQPGTDRAAIKPDEIVDSWLSVFEDAIEFGDSEAAGKLFLEESWWRDILALSWRIRAFHTEQLGEAIKEAQETKVANIRAVTAGVLTPRVADMGPFTLVESAFTFETKVGTGTGYLRLANSAVNEWKAWIVMTNLKEIRGHEELHKKSIGPTWSTLQDHAEYEAKSRKSPRVIIVGAGHSGLATAARLKQLGVPTLMVDKCGR
jgi:hypothetical protein